MTEQPFDTSPEAIKTFFAQINERGAKAEAARQELEKFAAWISESFFNGESHEGVVEAYLDDIRNGWKPEEDNATNTKND